MPSRPDTKTKETPSQDSVCNYLVRRGVAKDHTLYRDNLRFLEALKRCANTVLEEAVPAEMMQLFTDQQWHQLLFEFQPSMQLFSSEYDIPQLRQRIESGDVPVIPVAGGLAHWLIFRDSEGTRVRSVSQQEYTSLTEAQHGNHFARIAAMLWPALDDESAHSKLTEVLLGWLSEGLVIDAGVPLPADAELEQEQS